MANYQSTKALETEIEGLQNTRGSGLMQALRNREIRSKLKKLGDTRQSNDDLRTQELSMLLKGDQTGRVGDTLVARRADQFVPRHPDLIEALRARNSQQTPDMVEYEFNKKNPDFSGFIQSQKASGAGPSDLQYYMGLPSESEDAKRALQFHRNQYLNTGGEFTDPLTRETITKTPTPDANPVLRGRQTAAVEAAKTAALSGNIAIENQGAVDKANQLAAAPLKRNADQALMLLDMAEPLLETATGSGLGAMRDQAGALVGVGGEGAESAAQLKAIAGLLIAKMPRMEGPQSNLDVQLYREMAGQIGDPTVPNNVRKAALGTIRQLNEKYASQAAQMAPEEAPPVSGGRYEILEVAE